MDLSSIDAMLYEDIDDDSDLMAELLALQTEERKKTNAKVDAQQMKLRKTVQTDFTQIDKLVQMLSEEANIEDDYDSESLENDPELLNEFADLLSKEASKSSTNDDMTKFPPKDNEIIGKLKQNLQVYKKAVTAAGNDENSARARRCERAVKTLEDLLKRAERGDNIDEGEIPVLLPIVESNPQVEPRKNSIPIVPPTDFMGIRNMFIQRRDAYKKNAAMANHVHDKAAAIEYFKVARQFDAAIAALDSGEIGDSSDISDVPPFPKPYVKLKPTTTSKQNDAPKMSKTLLEGLEQRLAKYKLAVDNAENDRKKRQNMRIVRQYESAINMHKSGQQFDLSGLPTPPGFPSLPTNVVSSSAAVATRSRSSTPSSGPYAPIVHTDDGPSPPKQSRQSQQLAFLEKRQQQFRKAALDAKRTGDLKQAKQHLLSAKGFDSLISTSKAGLPVDVSMAPNPPRMPTDSQCLQPVVVPSSSISGGRSEVFATLEKDLIRQAQISDRNRDYFGRLGDVGQINKYERLADGLRTDLLRIRQALQRDESPPSFRYETKTLPSLHICPDLGMDDLQLTVAGIWDVKLPSGYRPEHADIYVQFEFPFPQESPQSGRTKTIAGSTSPVFSEKFTLRINHKSRQLLRMIKRQGVKFTIYQKGSFLRSDKLLGTCECKLHFLENKAEFDESLDLLEGRKPIGGRLQVKIRIREPLIDKKRTEVYEKWLVLGQFTSKSIASSKPPLILPILPTNEASSNDEA